MKLQIKRDGDIEIDLQDTQGATGIVFASVTGTVLARWRHELGDRVQAFRHKDPRPTSTEFEVIFITPKPGVDKVKLHEELNRLAQTIIADHFVAKARCQ